MTTRRLHTECETLHPLLPPLLKEPTAYQGRGVPIPYLLPCYLRQGISEVRYLMNETYYEYTSSLLMVNNIDSLIGLSTTPTGIFWGLAAELQKRRTIAQRHDASGTKPSQSSGEDDDGACSGRPIALLSLIKDCKPWRCRTAVMSIVVHAVT